MTMRTLSLILALTTVCAVGARAENYSANETISGETAWETPITFDIDAGCTVTVTRVISGDGAVAKSGDGTLVLAAANTFTGGITFYRGEIHVTAQGALGTGDVTYCTDSGAHTMDFKVEGGRFPNRFIFAGKAPYAAIERGQITFSASTTLDGDIIGCKDMTLMIGNTFNSNSSPLSQPHSVFNGNIICTNCTFRSSVYGVHDYNGRIDAKSVNLNRSWSGNGHIHLNASGNNLGSGNAVSCYCPYFICGAVNAISNFRWQTQYNYKTQTANCMNLGGFDQNLRCVTISPVDSPSYVPPCAPGDGDNLRFYTEKPATLTLTGLPGDVRTCQHHAFSGALSVVLDAESSGYTLYLTNRTHLMSGDLTIRKGTMQAGDYTSFRKARSVNVAADAAFVLETAAENALECCRSIDVGAGGRFVFTSAAAQTFAIRPVVTLAPTAEITLPADSTLPVRSLAIDGEAVPEGVYEFPCAEIPQLKGGKLRVGLQDWPELVEPVYTITLAEGTNRLDAMTVSVTEGGDTTERAFTDLTITEGTIRKLGDGVVVSSTRLANFRGQLLVEDGGFAVDDNLELGPTNVNATAVTVWVKKGASYIIQGTKDTCGEHKLRLGNATYHFAGDGHNGQGALDISPDAAQQSMFGNCGGFYLDADTLISGSTTKRIDFGGFNIYTRGNRLKFARAAGRSDGVDIHWASITLPQPGEMLIDGVNISAEAVCTWPAGLACDVVLTNSGMLSYYNGRHANTADSVMRFPAGTLGYWRVGGSVSADQYMMYPGNVKYGWWDGPVQVDGTAEVYAPYDGKGAAFRGPVRGAGDLRLSSGWFHFMNAASDFTGRMALFLHRDYKFVQGIAVYTNNALPKCCAGVAVTNGEFRLMGEGRFDLPEVEMCALAGTNLVFSGGGSGTIAGLAKTGPGSLDFTSPLTVEMLEVAEGTLDTKGAALTVGTLLAGGGTLKGDVTVTGSIGLSAKAVTGASLAPATIQGSLTFAPGAVADFAAAAASARLRGRQTLLTATGGITGLPGADAGSAASPWYLFVEDNAVVARHLAGLQLILR